MVGAVIAANVNQNFQLIDLHSDGSNHYLRFEENQTPSRVLFRLRHLSDDFVDAQVQGHLADVVVGYGEPCPDLEHLWKELRVDTLHAVLRAQEPGVILFEADLVGRYLYVQVPLLLELDRYLDAPPSSELAEFHDRHSSEEGLRVNLPRLVEDIDAIVHSLQVYLQGRVAQLRAAKGVG